MGSSPSWPVFFLRAFFVLFCSQAFGCSSTRVLYDHADWYVAREYNELLEMRGSRRQELREAVDEYFLLHRSELLPQYADFCDWLAEKIDPTDWQRADVDEIFNRLEALIKDSTRPSLAIMSRFLLTLTTEEIERLENNFQKQQTELSENFRSRTEEERQRRSFRNMQRFLRFVAGRQAGPQLELIQKYVEPHTPEGAEIWLAYRESMFGGLFDLLKKTSTRHELEAYLQDWLLKPERSRTEAHQKIIEEWIERTKEFLLDWYKSLTEVQRQQFRRRIEQISRDFRSLHRP